MAEIELNVISKEGKIIENIWTDKKPLEAFDSIYDTDDKFDELKALVLAGADCLHTFSGSKETVIDKIVRLNVVSFYEELLERNKKELNEKNDIVFRKQLGKGLETAAKIPNDVFMNLILKEYPLDFNIFEIAGSEGWRILDKLDIQYLDQQNNDNDTMLHFAALNNRSPAVRYLIERGASTNIQNNDGNTPLLLAVERTSENKDDQLVLSNLIENSDISITNDKGMNCLQVMAEKGKYEYIQRLIELGADPNTYNHECDDDDVDENIDRNYPLCIAAKNGHALVVRALVRNGASISIKDRYSKTALNYALENKKDETSAMLIRLNIDFRSVTSFTEKYGEDYSIKKLIEGRQKETLLALLDRSETETSNDKSFWDLNLWQEKDVLQGLDEWDDHDLVHHGTIQLLVDKKMVIGNGILVYFWCFHIFALLVLSYSLMQASTVDIPRDTYTQGTLNIVRIGTDALLVVYAVYNIIFELEEIYRIIKYTHLKKPTLISFIFKVFRSYLGVPINVNDLLAITTLVILIILRATNQPAEWVFATLTFFFHALHTYKLVLLIPVLGPYATTIFRILIHDVPLFLSLFLINLLIFTGTFNIALRTPYTPEGFRNYSLVQDTTRTPGVDIGIQWIFLSGLRVLLHGNVYQDDFVDTHLNWLAASIYLAFLFITSVVMLNVLIAQLSDRYAVVKKKANQIHHRQKLRSIVKVQTSKTFVCCFTCWTHCYTTEIASKRRWSTYFPFSDPSTVNNEKINALLEVKQYYKPPPIVFKKKQREEAAKQRDSVQMSEQVWDDRKEMEHIMVKLEDIAELGDIAKLEESIIRLDQRFELTLGKLSAIQETLFTSKL